VLDPRTAKIVWIEKIGFESKDLFIPTGQDKLLVNDRNLFALDNRGNLYVYEKISK
jgi:hypothetical protein